MSERQVRILAVLAALVAAALRLAATPIMPTVARSAMDWVLFAAPLLVSFLAPIACYLFVAGRLRRRPATLRAGDQPGTLLAPARLLTPGLQLILGAWLAVHTILIDDRYFFQPLLAAAVLALGVAIFVRPRPRLILDASGVTIRPWYLQRPVRMLWGDLNPAAPVRTANGTFIDTGTVVRVSLSPTGARPVPVPVEHLDVEPAYLARVMSELATAPDRQAFIDNNLSAV
ncbi:hypothetical protein [Catenuloplanes indicus]|uniref:PH domain-containing protein n=1 Tax=Catenuloplanes indicus TaxID=137267 RepID=A0AAE4B0J3_9ACTN|nr:hypothetical protein [Catenuloplanes indicus]MDQ0369632.1 hypothetical protein [Catenuloplanes indicus]